MASKDDQATILDIGPTICCFSPVLTHLSPNEPIALQESEGKEEGLPIFQPPRAEVSQATLASPPRQPLVRLFLLSALLPLRGTVGKSPLRLGFVWRANASSGRSSPRGPSNDRRIHRAGKGRPPLVPSPSSGPGIGSNQLVHTPQEQRRTSQKPLGRHHQRVMGHE